MHKTQRPFLIRWLFFIFLLAHDNMSVRLADNSVVILHSLEMEVGRYLHSCPTVSESQTLQKGWGVQAQHGWLLVNVTQLCFPHQRRWKLASRFVPLWSVCLAQKDQKMVERGLCIWGGMCSTFRLMKPLHFPLPQLALHRLSHPWSKGGTTGPLSAVLARSPMGGGVWLQWCYEVTAPFLVPRSLGGQKKHLLLISSPRVAGYWFRDNLDALDSGGSPSLCRTTDTKQCIDHTQAVQPSYSCARLSRFVASLMTKSTYINTNVTNQTHNSLVSMQLKLFCYTG